MWTGPPTRFGRCSGWITRSKRDDISKRGCGMQSLFVWGWEGGGNRASRKRRLCLVIQASRTGGARQCRAGGRADCLPRGKHRFYAKRLAPMVFSPSAARRGAGGERKATLLASTGNNFAVSNSPWRGLTRRLRRGLGLAVPWGAHTFLSVAKEKCAKESQRHGDSGKKPLIAHF